MINMIKKLKSWWILRRVSRKFNNYRIWVFERLATNKRLESGFIGLGNPSFFGGIARPLASPFKNPLKAAKTFDNAHVVFNKLKTAYKNNEFNEFDRLFAKIKSSRNNYVYVF